jgi:N-ethylmaleimide reductase
MTEPEFNPEFDTAADAILRPLAVGRITLANRIVQAPMGRLRADLQGCPGELMTEFYRQRADMGLIVSDGTSPSRDGRVFVTQPGLYDDDQIPGWTDIAEAVHGAGGRIVAQLMHAGWNTHQDVTGLPVVSASAVDHRGWAHDAKGNRLPFGTPTALDAAGLGRIRADFAAAAGRAVRAGLDGVELHAANGYLLHSFLAPNSNTRTDSYGGSPENRARFVTEVAAAVAAEIGADRLGVRISPGMTIQGAVEDDDAVAAETYAHLIDGFNALGDGTGIAYLNLAQPDLDGDLARGIRDRFHGPVFANRNTGTKVASTRRDALDILALGYDAAAVGRPALANPDLVERWTADAPEGNPENTPDPKTFYFGGAAGYTDYPVYAG